MPFQWFMEMYPPTPRSAPPPDESHKMLADRHVGWLDLTRLDVSPGRRLRVFGALIMPKDGNHASVVGKEDRKAVLIDREMVEGRLTYAQAYAILRGDAAFSSLPLRVLFHHQSPERITEQDEQYAGNVHNPELHASLQDLGDEINEDVREACFAFDDPDLYYPGIDEGIEPVTDEFVRFVIWGLQRELNRELRPAENIAVYPYTVLPAVPLAELPWRIQRALVERRRFRYAQYGITRANWESGTWSLWDVPEDPDWVPRRSARLMGQ